MKSRYKLQINEPEEQDAEDDDEEFEQPAYLYLPSHPGENVYGAVAKTIRLQDIYPYNGGPDVNLDFDQHNNIIGIELL